MPRNQADKTLAERAVLMLSDFPTGWTSQPPSSKEAPGSVADKLGSCLHVDPSVVDPGASAYSEDFTSSSGQTVTASVNVAMSASQVTRMTDALSQPDAANCLASTYSGSFENAAAGLTFGKPSVNPLPFGRLGDRTMAFRLAVTAESQAFSVPIYADLVLTQKGRSLVRILAVETSTPFPTAMSEELIGKSLARLPSS